MTKKEQCFLSDLISSNLSNIKSSVERTDNRWVQEALFGALDVPLSWQLFNMSRQKITQRPLRARNISLVFMFLSGKCSFFSHPHCSS